MQNNSVFSAFTPRWARGWINGDCREGIAAIIQTTFHSISAHKFHISVCLVLYVLLDLRPNNNHASKMLYTILIEWDFNVLILKLTFI